MRVTVSCAHCQAPFETSTGRQKDKRGRYHSRACRDAAGADAHRTTPFPPAESGFQWIPLTRKKFARVDDADYQSLHRYTWHAIVTEKGNYAQTWIRGENGKKCTIRMHTMIMGTKGVDHADGDGLNNSRSNLRVATPTQNAQNRKPCGKNNTTGYKGVIARPDRPGKFRAKIVVNKEVIGLGDYDDPADAARAYDKAARKYFGEFARLNFPP